MKYNIIIITIALFVSASMPAWTQYSSDPSSTIYEDLHYWEGQGYISHLPQFRPLPEVTLIKALNEVMDKGDDYSAKIASRYLKNIEVPTIDYVFSGFGRLNSVRGDVEKITHGYGNGTMEAQATAQLSDFVFMSIGLGGHLLADRKAEKHNYIRETYFTRKSINRMEELENIKLTTASSILLEASLASRSSFTVGKENLFVQSGFMRRSVGVLHDDGIIVSPLAPQSANAIVYWEGKKLAATWVFLSLSSTQEYTSFEYDKETNTVTDDTETSTRNRLDKFMVYNSLTIRPNEKFEVSMFEAVAFGTLNLGYLLPIKIIYTTDSLSDFAAGNLIAGFNFKIKPVKTFTIPISFLIDDISVSQYIRFNFYSKLKAAGEIAAEWTPRTSLLKEAKVGYQIVTPYTYTHPPATTYETYSTAYNDANFTHNGQHLATTLEPSSHRVYFNTAFMLFRKLKIGTIMRMEQHNNSSYGYLRGPLNDGSIVDDGYRSVYDDDNGSESATFQKRFDFLVGPIETKYEAGINFGAEVALTKQVNIFSDVNYTYRYINNYQLSHDTKIEGIFQIEIGISIQQRIFNRANKINYTEDSRPLKYDY